MVDHKFGWSDWLSGNDYEPGTVIWPTISKYVGRRTQKDVMGEEQDYGFYLVDIDGRKGIEYRMNMENERELRMTFGVESPLLLEGHKLGLKVIAFNKGNGFMVTGLLDLSGKSMPKAGAKK